MSNSPYYLGIWDKKPFDNLRVINLIDLDQAILIIGEEQDDLMNDSILSIVERFKDKNNNLFCIFDEKKYHGVCIIDTSLEIKYNKLDKNIDIIKSIKQYISDKWSYDPWYDKETNRQIAFILT